MARFSHADPRYQAALQEMGRNLRKLLDERDWTQADLVRATRLHMPIDPATGLPGRYDADNASNMMNGKRRPTRAFVKAVSAALGIEDGAFLPDFLRADHLIGGELKPLLTEVPGKPGIFRVFIDQEFPIKQALRIVGALEGEANNAS